MRAHIVENGVVVNTIEVASLDVLPGLIDGSQGSIGDTWDGQAFNRPTPPVDRGALAAHIDAAVAAVYDRPMTYSKEYEAREAQAQAYKDAGYTGPVPARVAGFATPAGMTTQAATDLILLQAAQFRSALDQLSDLRMQKYAVTRQDANGAYVATDAEAQALADATLASVAAIAADLE